MSLKKFQRDDSAAGNTSGLWIAIFQYHFNVRDGFAHRPGYRTSRGGFIDITSVKWIGGNHTTYWPYLITQKKKKSRETSESGCRMGQRGRAIGKDPQALGEIINRNS